jgi:hypothetical protein
MRGRALRSQLVKSHCNLCKPMPGQCNINQKT